jgi:hypothetical protein
MERYSAYGILAYVVVREVEADVKYYLQPN